MSLTPEQKVEQEAQAAKNKALLIGLQASLKELERRQASGELDAQAQSVPLMKLLDGISKLANSMKGPLIQINASLPAPADREMLSANSARNLTPAGKIQLRAKMKKQLAQQKKPIDAEVVKDGK